MFNGDLKKEAIAKLTQSAESYKYYAKIVQAASAELFVLRKQSSEEVIGAVEDYINTLANTPKEFDRSFAEYKAEFRVFTQMLRDLQIKSDNVDFEFGTTATAGILAGAVVWLRVKLCLHLQVQPGRVYTLFCTPFRQRIMAGKKACPPYTKPPTAKTKGGFYCLKFSFYESIIQLNLMRKKR